MERIINNFWVPCFSGFYETIWDEECSSSYLAELYDVEEVADEELEDFDFSGYSNDIAKCVSDCVLSDISKKLGVEIEISNPKVVSPKEYNFYNDQIFCDLKISDWEAFKEALKKEILDNIEYYKKCVKDTFTPYSGFIPFYSTELNEFDWENNDLPLHCILEYMLTKDDDEDCNYEYLLYEYASCNGMIQYNYYPKLSDRSYKERMEREEFEKNQLKIPFTFE